MMYLPTSHWLTFSLDTEKSRYIVATCEPGFTRVPYELIVEDRRFNNFINADLILRGTTTTKKTGGRAVQFFTGLQPTAYSGVYLGNVLTYGRVGEPIRNGIVVRFSTDAKRMALRYFPAYYPYPNMRAAFVAEIINQRLI